MLILCTTSPVHLGTVQPLSQCSSLICLHFAPRSPWPMEHCLQDLLISCCSVAKSCPSLCNLTGCSTTGSSVLHYLLKLAQTHVHQVGDAIQPSHPLLSPSPPTFNLSQHQSLFQWVVSSHQVAKVLELQLQHPSFQWIFRVGFLQDQFL